MRFLNSPLPFLLASISSNPESVTAFQLRQTWRRHLFAFGGFSSNDLGPLTFRLFLFLKILEDILKGFDALIKVLAEAFNITL
jgi:hypothetical protein